jgi:hypothetical protein
VSDPPARGVVLADAVLLGEPLGELLVELQAVAARASRRAVPPRQSLRVVFLVFRPVEPSLTAFSHSI